MIPKGNQRGGGQQLATHLLNSIDNERVEVMELRGSIAADLHGAFAEWRAASTGTRCRKYLYSLSVNPDPGQRKISRDEFRDFISRAEKSLGLGGQPRAVVFHTKNGREHCHVVWSRIDTDRLKAIQLSHDRQKLRTVARDFARDRGLELPRGMKKDRGQKRYDERKKESSLAERQQEERTGLTKQQRQREITDAWQQTADGKAFMKALEQKGYALAEGAQRAYVVIDRYGEIHALARQIQGAKSRDVKERLRDVPLETLPAAQQVQNKVRAKTKAALREYFIIQNDPRRKKMDKAHEKKRDTLEKKKAALLQRQQQQRERLLQRIKDRNQKSQASKTRGFRAFWTRLTGQPQQTGITPGQKRAIEAQQRRHARQLRNITRQERSLTAIKKRETGSLETKIKREIRQRFRETGRQPLTKEQTQALQKFIENARDIARRREAPEKTARETERSTPPEKQAEKVPEKTSEKQTALPFREAAQKPEKEFSKEFINALRARAAGKKERGKDPDRGRGPRL